MRVRLATDDADNGDAGDDNHVGVHDDNDDDDRHGNPWGPSYLNSRLLGYIIYG